MFYNEVDMLKFRLAHLNSVVDYFIIAEATVSHQNTPHELVLEKIKDELQEYEDKIIYVVVDDMPGGNSSKSNWERERHQRKALSRGFEKLHLQDNDIILLSCCDEIPNSELVAEIKEKGLNIFNTENNLKYKPPHTKVEQYSEGISLFYMDMYWFNLNTKSKFGWTLSRACNYRKFKEFDNFQNFIEYSGDVYYKLGGWHFTFFGNVTFAIEKIKSFAHDEYNKDNFLNPEHIKLKIENKEDLFNRPHENFYHIEIEDNEFLPFNYRDILDNENFKN